MVPGGIDKNGSVGNISLAGTELSRATDNSKVYHSKTMKAAGSKAKSKGNVSQDPGVMLKHKTVAAPVDPSMLDEEFSETDMNMTKAGTMMAG